MNVFDGLFSKLSVSIWKAVGYPHIIIIFYYIIDQDNNFAQLLLNCTIIIFSK